MTFYDPKGIEYSADNPLIMSGAGLCKYARADAIRPYSEAADAVVVGSITLDPRAGNEGTCEYFENPLYGINSWGMPNDGSESVAVAKLPFHNLVVSVAEFSADGYAEVFRRLHNRFSAVEINLGCPNTDKEIFSFSPYSIGETLAKIGRYSSDVHIGVKLSPYTDMSLLKTVAKVIAQSGVVNYVATTNTIPGGVAFRPDRTMAIDTRETGIVGGISGEALKLISLANARAFRQVLPDSIDVIRVGGISTGQDVWDSYKVGCAGVQVVTAIAQHGLKVLTKIREEYVDLND